MSDADFEVPALDDGIRGEPAVLVSLRRSDDGRCLIVLDDAYGAATEGAPSRRSFFTHFAFEATDFEASSFPQDALKGLGLAVLARLAAQASIQGPRTTP